jgi:hypothetical protein
VKLVAYFYNHSLVCPKFVLGMGVSYYLINNQGAKGVLFSVFFLRVPKFNYGEAKNIFLWTENSFLRTKKSNHNAQKQILNRKSLLNEAFFLLENGEGNHCFLILVFRKITQNVFLSFFLQKKQHFF